MATTNLITHEVQSVTVLQRETDGYFNATKLSQAAGKRFHNYLRNDTTEAFLAALEAETHIRASELIQTVKGGNGQQGTWVHPLVAMNLAQWLSPEFAVKVSQWIFEWMGQGKKPDPEFLMIHKSVLQDTGKALVWMGDYGVTSQPYYGGAGQPTMIDGRPQYTLPDSITVPMDDWMSVCDCVFAVHKVFGEALSHSINNNYAPIPAKLSVPSTLGSQANKAMGMIYTHTFRQVKTR